MENCERLDSIVNHILSGKVVITNSYHGVYWSGLLNRKVIAVPFSTKFYNFRNAVCLETSSDKLLDINYLETISNKIGVTRNFLELCRNSNLHYSHIVSKIVGIDIIPKEPNIEEVNEGSIIGALKWLKNHNMRNFTDEHRRN